jgi:hypothetical protein
MEGSGHILARPPLVEYRFGRPGFVVALTKDDGTITGAQMFDSWGGKIATSSIGDVPAYGYTGCEPDATGLVYYPARATTTRASAGSSVRIRLG